MRWPTSLPVRNWTGESYQRMKLYIRATTAARDSAFAVAS